MKRITNSFKWRHFEPEIFLLCVRWYCRYQLSYRDLAEMMRERLLRYAVNPKRLSTNFACPIASLLLSLFT